MARPAFPWEVKKDMDLEKFKDLVNSREGYMRFNGIEVTKLEPGFCEARAPMGPDKTNPHGMAHGGFLFTLCDSVAGIAASTRGRNVVGRSADIHYLRPGDGAYVTARATVVHEGLHMALADVKLYNDREELIVTAQVEMFFIGKIEM